MEKYETPIMEVVRIDTAVIETSCNQPCSYLCDDELPII